MKLLFRFFYLTLLSALLISCGGGGGSSSGTGSPDNSGGNSPPLSAPSANSTFSDMPATRAEAARFLNQASFGATDASINRVMAIGYSAWINEQLAMTGNRLSPRVTYLHSLDNNYFLYDERSHYQAWYWAALSGNDQLRQRMAYALSQIFVVSMENPTISFNRAVIPAYYDMLLDGAFGNYRQLLEKVSLHPAMGIYLTHMANAKEDAVTGVRPDENYAREVMQLFSVGLWQLNLDGTQKLQNNQPIPTYDSTDVKGLAKVFTGWSWGDIRADWRNAIGFYDKTYGHVNNNAWKVSMVSYPEFHSTSEKKFLGLTIPAQSTANPEASLKAALDHIAAHPNVAPFIARRLIQHFVTSNPTPAYVGRVAAVFNSSNGNLGQVIRAVLLDPEARDTQFPENYAAFGKLREPVLRLTQAIRAFNYQSSNGRWMVTTTTHWFTDHDPVGTIGQLPMHAPSVFNFFRPGYVPLNSEISRAGLGAPEFQIFHESSSADWINSLRVLLFVGTGNTWYINPFKWEITSTFSAEASLANNPDALVDRLSTLLNGGKVSAALRNDIKEAVNLIPITDNASRKDRAQAAIFLFMSSPEYLVQR